MNYKRRWLDAIHEVSHAVACLALHQEVIHVMLGRRGHGTSRGECRIRVGCNEYHLIILWAGFIGEAIDQGGSAESKMCLGRDFPEAEECLNHLGITDRQKRDEMHVDAAVKARDLLTKHWVAVVQVAQLLMRKGTVSGDTIRRAMALNAHIKL